MADSINLATAQFSWTAPVVDATHGAPTFYTVKCGAASGLYLVLVNVVPPVGSPLPPATSLPVKTVVGGGTWFCVYTASNAGGESPSSNEVTFSAGFPPTVGTLTAQ